jgi:hypothetical protein
MSFKYVKLIWMNFFEISGIQDLTRVPQIDDPEHSDVKAIVFVYSMESFLFIRLNQISR